MAGNAFTAGVKPGGLTTSTEIRILLCYLIHNAGSPISQHELETALLSEELVNYFEIAPALDDLCRQELIREEDGRYSALPAGREVAETLASDVPRSVREAATRALVRAQQFTRRSAEHHVDIVPCSDGFSVRCSISDRGTEMFALQVYMPDRLSAKLARERFIENGADLYRTMLDALTTRNKMPD